MTSRKHRCAGRRGARSEFWRTLSWYVGDVHADRICWLVDAYCVLFRVRGRIDGTVPR